ncbi:MAG TPA: translocation/assembly module TamB domain-containing protein [Kofleriaceae bacterium]
MRRVWKWTKRVLGTLALLLLVVLTTVLIVIHTDWGRERIRRIVQDRLPANIKIGRLEGSIFTTLRVRDIEIDAPDGKPMVTIGKVTADIGLWSFARKTVQVNSIEVEDVAVHIRPQPSTAPKAAETSAAESGGGGGGSSWTIVVDEVRVRRATADVQIATDTYSFDDIAINAAARWPAHEPIGAAVNLSATWRERKLPIQVAATAAYDKLLAVPLAIASVGDVHLSGVDVVIDGERSRGIVTLSAPAAAVARGLPDVQIPGDVAIAVHVAPEERTAGWIDAEVFGALGEARIRGTLRGALAAKRATAIITATAPDLGRLTGDGVAGAGAVTIVAAGDPHEIHAVIATGQQINDAPPTDALIFATATLEKAEQKIAAVVAAAGDGAVRVAAVGGAHFKDGVLTLDRTTVRGSATNLDAATNGLVPVVGAVRFGFRAHGPVWPVRAIAVGDGIAAGTGVRVLTPPAKYRSTLVSIGSAAADFEAALGDVPIAHGHASAAGIAYAGKPYGRAVVDVDLRPGGALAVNATAWPVLPFDVGALPAAPATSPSALLSTLGARVRAAAPPLRVEAGALIRFPSPGTIDIAIDHHAMFLPTGETWTGTGGRVAITPAQISVSGFRTSHAGGSLAIDATLARGADRLTAKLDATEFPAAMLSPQFRGLAFAKLDVTRARGAWTATGEAKLRGIAVRPTDAPFDASAKVTVLGRRIDLEGNIVHPIYGTAAVTVGVLGPPDLTDVRSWKRLERHDLDTLTIKLTKLDAGALGVGGTVSGTIALGATNTHGDVSVRGVPTKLGPIDSDVTITGAGGDELVASATAKLPDIGDAGLVARFGIPAHPLDPLAWKTLGPDIFRGASFEIDDVAIDPGLASRFGVDLPYRGKADLALAVGEAATSARFDVDVTNLLGGAIQKPITMHAHVTSDAKDTHVFVTAEGLDVRSGPPGAASLPPANTTTPPPVIPLFDVRGVVPVALRDWAFAPLAQLGKPITGSFVLGARSPDDTAMTAPAAPDPATTLGGTGAPASLVARPTVAAKSLLAVFGRTDVAGGTLAASADVTGTVLNPHATLVADALDVAVAPRFGKQVPMLTKLHVEGTFADRAGTVAINGSEAGGGTIDLSGGAALAHPSAAHGKLVVKQLDLAPIAVFLPGPLVATTGTLRADLTMASLAAVTGTVHIEKGRLPIAPSIGTLRQATVDITVKADQRLEANATGLLGAGKVELKATGSPEDVDANIQLTKISPIGALQPQITGHVEAKLKHVAEQWRGDITVRDTSVLIPNQSGNELLATGVPSDMILLDGKLPQLVGAPQEPQHPWLVATVDLGNTRIDGEDLGDAVSVHTVVHGKLTVSYGDGIGLDGSVSASHADVTLFGRLYQVDTGSPLVEFDGTTDPLLDISLVHEFPDLTLTAHVGERASKPEVTFSSQPGDYSEAQLFGFFLGGEPGGDASSQTREAAAGAAAAGAGTAVISAKLARAAHRVIPVKLFDNLTCEPSTSTTSTACTIGRWLTRKLYIAYQAHVDARVDENANEGLLQYYFARKWSLDLSGGDRNYDGLDILWRTRW